MTTKERETAAKKVEGHEVELSPGLLKAYKKEHGLEDETIEQKINDKPAPSKATPLTESGVNDKETVKKKRAFEARLIDSSSVDLKVRVSISPPDVPIERKLGMVEGVIGRIKDVGCLSGGTNTIVEGVEDFGEIEEKWQATLEEEREKTKQVRKRLRRANKKIKEQQALLAECVIDDMCHKV